MNRIPLACLFAVAAAWQSACGSNADISTNANLVKNANAAKVAATPCSGGLDTNVHPGRCGHGNCAFGQ